MSQTDFRHQRARRILYRIRVGTGSVGFNWVIETVRSVEYSTDVKCAGEGQRLIADTGVGSRVRISERNYA